MKRQLITIFLGLMLIALCAKCSNSTTSDKTNLANNAPKCLPTDPFAKSMVKSQYFAINSNIDQVIEGANGTVIVCPKGCFLNAEGKTVEGDVKIELAEALSLEEMILSNLTTKSNGKPLETDGMIYLNATANGAPLAINKDNPIHIEIPTKNKKQGMSVYSGTRDSLGNMNWIDPKPLENYLVSVDLDLLNFLPDGFQAEVEKGMPYKGYKTATSALTDSLYYILSVTDGSELVKGFVNTNINEPYYNKNKQVVKGRYTKSSYQKNITIDSMPAPLEQANTPCGIDPAIIKVIKSKKYQNTLIATREFEARLKLIFETCNSAVLEIYTKNLDKNLYSLDSLAELAVGESHHARGFHDFYLQRKTKVKNADKYAKLLQGYYEKQLAKTKANLEEAKQKTLNGLAKKNKEAENVLNNYKKLLWDREKYRMEKYGFEWTATGWINIDNGTIPKTWGPQNLEVSVQNAKQFDQIYTYVVYSTIKSIYRLNTDDNALFYVGNDEEKEMLMPKRSHAFAIVIAYKDENAFLCVKQFETGTNKTLSALPIASTPDEIKKTLQQYNKGYEKENKISKDLAYMQQFFVEQKRQKALLKESEFLNRLWRIAFPCCPS